MCKPYIQNCSLQTYSLDRQRKLFPREIKIFISSDMDKRTYYKKKCTFYCIYTVTLNEFQHQTNYLHKPCFDIISNKRVIFHQQSIYIYRIPSVSPNEFVEKMTSNIKYNTEVVSTSKICNTRQDVHTILTVITFITM